MKRILWLDVDGVLLEYTREFFKFARIPKSTIDYSDYNLSRYFETPEKCRKTMEEFACSEQFTHLPIICNRAYLQAILQAGVELRAITKLPVPPKGRANRLINLSWAFGPIFSQVVFTNSHECKWDLLRNTYLFDACPRDQIIIEDNPDFFLAVDKAPSKNVKVYGVRHPYNTKYYYNNVHNTAIKFVRSTDEALMDILEGIIKDDEVSKNNLY